MTTTNKSDDGDPLELDTRGGVVSSSAKAVACVLIALSTAVDKRSGVFKRGRRLSAGSSGGEGTKKERQV